MIFLFHPSANTEPEMCHIISLNTHQTESYVALSECSYSQALPVIPRQKSAWNFVMLIERKPLAIRSALAFSLLLPALGYFYLGPLIALLFLLGCGSAFVLWVLIPARPPYVSMNGPIPGDIRGISLSAQSGR
jgi:hypothetical protein